VIFVKWTDKEFASLRQGLISLDNWRF